MKDRIIKVIVGIIIFIIVAVLIVVSYLMIADIETKWIPSENEYSCIIDQKKYEKRNVFILTPKNTNKTDLTILYFHGGSYMAEITKEHWDFLEKVINDTGATVILPDYPLTPKYNYQDVFNMIEPLYKEIINKVNPDNLIVMGDSAGGGMALALEEKVSNEGIALPSKTILISPWLDARLENPEIEGVQKNDKQLNKDTLKLAGIAYANPDGIDSYLVNPIDGDLSKLKNVTIFTGTYDILNPDVHVLKERAEAQGANIEIKEYDTKKHIWILKEYGEGYNDLIESLER